MRTLISPHPESQSKLPTTSAKTLSKNSNNNSYFFTQSKMKPATITSILALITAAAGTPANMQRRQSGASCNAGSLSQLCCNTILGGIALTCVLQVIGGPCETQAFCCDVEDNSQVSFGYCIPSVWCQCANKGNSREIPLWMWTSTRWTVYRCRRTH